MKPGIKTCIILLFLILLILSLTACGGKVQTFTVEFRVDGETIHTESVKSGEGIVPPQVPVRVGYKGEWDIKSFSKITENIVVNAVYTPRTYKVIFKALDSNNVMRTIDTKNIDYGKSLTGIPTVPQREGYSGVWSVTSFPAVTSDMEVFAVYTKNIYTITFETNGGTPIADFSAAYESAVNVTTTKDGYEFLGWFTDEELQQSYDLTTIPSKNLKLYAKWGELLYTIYIDTGMPEYDTSIQKSYGAAIDSIQQYARQGYKFNGWYSDSAKTQLITFPYQVTGTATIYADWVVDNRNTASDSSYFVFNSATKTISANSSQTLPENIIIPSVYDNLIVQNIAARGFADAGIKTVQIPQSIISIGDYAFASDSIKTITFDEDSRLKDIGNGAFLGSAISEIVVPQNLQNIGNGAFKDCELLESIDFEEIENILIIGARAFENTIWYGNYIENVENSVIYIGKVLYEAIGTLSSNISIFADTVSISPQAFSGQTALTSINIPDTVTYIGGDYTDENFSAKGAFYNCNQLQYITFSAESMLEYVGKGAYAGCSLLREIGMSSDFALAQLFDTEESEYTYIVDYNSNIYYVPESLIKIMFFGNGAIKPYAFANTRIQNISVFGDIEEIGALAFYNCALLEAFDIPESVIVIDDYAFAECIDLSEISLGSENALKEIGEHAFSGLYNAVFNFENLNKLETVGQAAFNAASKLTSFYAPAIKTIGAAAFEYCSELRFISVPSGISAIKLLFAEAEIDIDGYYIVDGYAIPESLEEISVVVQNEYKDIADSFAEGLYSVVMLSLGEGIEKIGARAFAGISLVEFELPDSVLEIDIEAFVDNIEIETFAISAQSNLKIIGDSAFAGAEKLSSLYLPKDLEHFSLSAVAQCGIAAITVHNENENYFSHSGALYSGEKLLYYPAAKTGEAYSVVEGTKYIGERAFAKSQLKNLSLPSTILSFEEGAFDECAFDKVSMYALTLLSNIFPDSSIIKGLSILGEKVVQGFALSSQIKNLEITEGVTEIAHGAFASCEELESVSFPASLRKIDTEAFFGCSSLSEIIFAEEDALEHIGNSAFDYTSWLESKQTGTMIYVGRIAYAFYGDATDDTTLTIREGTIEITGGACVNQENITSVILPESLEIIGDSAFENTGIKELVLSKNLRKISNGAFRNITSLERVIFEGDSLAEIGISAFEHCQNLAEIENIPSNLKKIGSAAFKNTAIAAINIPEAIEEIGDYAFANCLSLLEISFDNLNHNIKFGSNIFDHTAWYNSQQNGILLLDENIIYSYKGEMPENYVLNIDNDIEWILPYAFYAQHNLQQVIFKTNLIAIGSFAFADCIALSEVLTVSDSMLRTIGESAFHGCSSLSEFTLTNEVEVFSQTVFEGCTSLTRFVIIDENSSERFRFVGNILYNANLTQILYVPYGIGGAVVIENKVTEIGDELFRGRAGITSIKLGNDITHIGGFAFADCVGLSEIIFGDNPKLEYIGDSAFENTAISAVTLPHQISYIGSDAFDYNSVSVTFTGNNPPEIIGDYQGATVYVPREYLDDYKADLPFGIVLPSRVRVEFIANNNVVAYYDIPYGQKLSAIPLPPAIAGHNAKWNQDGLEKVFKDDEFLALTEDIRIHAEYSSKVYNLTLKLDADEVYEEFEYTYYSNIIKPQPISLDGRQFLYWTENTETLAEFSLAKMPARNIELFPVWFDFTFVLNELSDAYGIGILPYNAVVPDNIIIPSAYNGKEVYAILEDAFTGIDNISKITLADTVEVIGDRAFKNSSLSSIIISNNSMLKQIGQHAFAGTDISSIELPTLNYIGAYAFASSALESIEVTVETFTAFGNRVFSSCQSLQSAIIICDDTELISSTQEGLFENCSNLSNVILPPNMAQLGVSMFAGCQSLQEISLPQVWVIGENAFNGCISLTSLELPKVVYIYENAFAECTSLQRVVFGDNITLHTIAENAFYGCTQLSYFVLPAAAKYIEANAFADCNNLKYFIIQENGSINDGVRGLTTDTDFLPEHVTIYVADEWDSSKTRWPQHNVELYRGIYEGFVAGVDASLLLYVVTGTEVTLPAFIETDRVESLHDDLFYGSSHVTKLTITDTYLIGLLDTAKPLSHLENVLEFISDYSIDGVLYNAAGDKLIAYPQGKPNEEFSIPESVTTITDYAFYAATLSAITLLSLQPAEIGENTFGNNRSDLKIYVPANALDNYRSAPIWSQYAERIFSGYLRHNDFLFVEHAEGLELAQYIGKEEDVTLPISLNGKNIISIGDYAFFDSGISCVSIPASIMYIGDYAFANNSALIKLSLPESIKTIGEGAFSACYNLTTIVLPKRIQLTEISQYAFYDCRSLQSIEIPISITKIAQSAFEKCHSLTSVIFTQNSQLSQIGERAFAQCVELKNINLQLTQKLATIGNRAFIECQALENIIIPETVVSIGEYAFVGSSKLKSVSFIGSSKLTVIGAYAFYQNNTIENFAVPASVTRIEPYAFFGNNLKQLTVAAGSNLAEIGAYAFGASARLLSVNLPSTVVIMREGAFAQSPSIRWMTLAAVEPPTIESGVWDASLRIYVPQNSLNVYKSAWAQFAGGINSINRIFGEYSIVPISGGAEIFQYLGSAGDVEIPQTINDLTVVSLGSYAFGAETLSVTIPDTVTTLKAAAFSNCGIETITLGANITSIAENAFYGCTSLAEIIVEGGNQSFVTIDNALYNTSRTRLIAYPAGNPQISFDIPQGVVEIGAGAFSGATELITINIPNSVTAVESRAFDGCIALENILFEQADKLLFAGDNAFKDTLWYQLQPNGVVYISSAGGGGLVALNYKGQMPVGASVSIDANAVSILPNAFRNSPNLSKFHIPSGIKYIGENVLQSSANVNELTMPGEFALGYLFGTVSYQNSYAAYNEPSKKTYYIPNALTRINIISENVVDYAYSNARSLVNVTIANSVMTIGRYAFFATAKNMALENIVFESVFNSNLTVIGSGAFKDCQAIVNLTLPNSLKSINSYAFSGLLALRNLVLETVEGVVQGELEYIGNNAFEGCTLLTSLFAPASLKFIGEKAFYNCTRMQTINLYSDCKLEEIGAYAFMNCTNLRAVATPYYLAKIGDRAFYGCIALDTFNYDRSSETLSYIGHEAFTNTPFYDGPQGITKLPQNQDAIIYFSKVAYAFNGNVPSAAVISLRPNTVSISPYLFANRSSIYKIVTVAPESTFYTVLVLNVNLKEIGRNAFFGNRSLFEVTLPDGLEVIGENAFGNCSTLETVTIEDANKLKYIGQDAFRNVPWYDNTVYGTALSATIIYIGNIAYEVKDHLDSNTEITLREGTVSITPYAFAEQPGLISIRIPSSIKSIAQFAFGNHLEQNERLINTIFINEEALLIANLAGIFTLASKIIFNLAPVQLIGNCAYNYYSVDEQGNTVVVTDNINIIDLLAIYKTAGTLPDIYVPRVYIDSYRHADGWSNIFDKIIPFDGIYSDYVVAENNGGYEIIYYRGNQTNLILPDELNGKEVTAIRSYAFGTEIVSVSGGENIKKLMPYAFAKCIGLQSITLPEGLADIGAYAFENCSALTAINIPASVKVIGNGAFMNCSALEVVTLNEGLRTISDFVFAFCARIVNITIPESVQQIGNNIFNDCMSLEIMIMKAAVPPSISPEGLYRSTVKVYVPDASLQAYKSAQNWRRYDDRTLALSQMADELIPQDTYAMGEMVTMTDAVGEGITVYIAPSELTTFEDLQDGYFSKLDGHFTDAIIKMPQQQGTFRVYVVMNSAIISVGNNIITVL